MKYYCTGELLENGYLKCVVPEMDNDLFTLPYEMVYSDDEMRKAQEAYLASLPLAALVVGGKTGWLEGYEERYEALEFPKQERWAKISKAQYDRVVPSYRRIVLVKKPEQEDEPEFIRRLHKRFDEDNNDEEQPAKKPEEKSEAETMCDKILPMREFYPSNIGRGIAEAKREGFIIGFKTASSVEDRPKWVKASERLPDDTKKDRPLYIRKTDSYYIGWLSLTRDIWVTINDDFNKNEDIEWLEEP